MPDSTMPNCDANTDLNRQIILWQENEYALLIANAMSNGVLILNENRQVVFANELFLKMTHSKSMNSIIGKRPGNVFHCMNADIEPEGCGASLFCKSCGVIQAFLSALEGGKSAEECLIERTGNLPPMELRVWTTPVELKGIKFTIFSLEDIHLEKEHSALLQKLKLMSETDELTRLHNRRYLYNEALREISRAQRYKYPISIFMIDIDRFKQINDQYGHLIGDEVLVAFANELMKSVRKMDIVVRWGGDEFVILMPEADTQHAASTAERLLESIAAIRVPTPTGDIAITISIGTSGFTPGSEITFDQLTKEADEALYLAKEGGRNKVVHWDRETHQLP